MQLCATVCNYLQPSGNVKITYKVSRKKCTYYLKGNIRKTTYPLFKTSLKLNDVDTESNMEHLIPGDIIAYTSSSGRAHHVAIYIGKFDTKQDLVNYLNSDAVGLNCTGNESWISHGTAVASTGLSKAAWVITTMFIYVTMLM